MVLLLLLAVSPRWNHVTCDVIHFLLVLCVMYFLSGRTATPTGCSVNCRWQDASSCWTWRRTSECDINGVTLNAPPAGTTPHHGTDMFSLSPSLSAVGCCLARPASSSTSPMAPLWPPPTLW